MSATPTETVMAEDTSRRAFYRDMNAPQRRTFWACAGGWALDGMDFMIYPLVVGTIIKLWSVDAGSAGLAITVTLLASAITCWLPRFLTTERKLSIVGSTGYLAALIVGSLAGYLVGTWLADRIGRRNLFLLFSVGAIAVVMAYTQLPLSNEVLWVLGFPLGFFASGYFSGMGALLTELYPTRLRGSGQGSCYDFGRRIGALFPALVGYLSASMSLAAGCRRHGAAAQHLIRRGREPGGAGAHRRCVPGHGLAPATAAGCAGPARAGAAAAPVAGADRGRPYGPFPGRVGGRPRPGSRRCCPWRGMAPG